ncbi:hypothetical protein MKX01_006895 [Papaver californicum]|nr:hypothetical protein MKX01_006895 [Papaver californicum]
MEKNITSMSLLDQKPLIVNQLTQAKELLNQLQFGVDVITSTTAKLLVPRILSSFESSLSMLNGIRTEAGFQMAGLMHTADSPCSVIGSPRSASNLIGKHSKKRQVQRTGAETSIFRVMYLGRHKWKPHKKLEQHGTKRTRKSQETLINFQTGGHVSTMDFDTTQVVLRSPSFSLPSASIPIPCKEIESNNSNICSSLTPDNHFMSSGHNLQTSEYFICDFTSALPSAVDSPEAYLDWDWDSFDGFCF